MAATVRRATWLSHESISHLVLLLLPPCLDQMRSGAKRGGDGEQRSVDQERRVATTDVREQGAASDDGE
jgi:hypothetical protein